MFCGCRQAGRPCYDVTGMTGYSSKGMAWDHYPLRLSNIVIQRILTHNSTQEDWLTLFGSAAGEKSQPQLPTTRLVD